MCLIKTDGIFERIPEFWVNGFQEKRRFLIPIYSVSILFELMFFNSANAILLFRSINNVFDGKKSWIRRNWFLIVECQNYIGSKVEIFCNPMMKISSKYLDALQWFRTMQKIFKWNLMYWHDDVTHSFISVIIVSFSIAIQLVCLPRAIMHFPHLFYIYWYIKHTNWSVTKSNIVENGFAGLVVVSSLLPQMNFVVVFS